MVGASRSPLAAKRGWAAIGTAAVVVTSAAMMVPPWPSRRTCMSARTPWSGKPSSPTGTPAGSGLRSSQRWRRCPPSTPWWVRTWADTLREAAMAPRIAPATRACVAEACCARGHLTRAKAWKPLDIMGAWQELQRRICAQGAAARPLPGWGGAMPTTGRARRKLTASRKAMFCIFRSGWAPVLCKKSPEWRSEPLRRTARSRAGVPPSGWSRLAYSAAWRFFMRLP